MSSATAIKLLDLIQSHRITTVIYVAAKLGIAELLRDGPRSLDELVRATSAHPDALRRLLTTSQDDYLRIQYALSELVPHRLELLVVLARLDPFFVLELRQCLSSDPAAAAAAFMDLDPMDDGHEPQLKLDLFEHPAERCVYRRNLKPAPRLRVLGRAPSLAFEESLQIVPLLVRCDTQIVLDGKMLGNAPVNTCAGALVEFKKLKISLTSHQLNETLFCVRFELRLVRPDRSYEVIALTQTPPIYVVSHSSNLKAATVPPPVVLEICPSFGPIVGNTRVAIIGQNFVMNERACVRIANFELQPQFRDQGTLICTFPGSVVQEPGDVQVHVSNDSNLWSESSFTFTFIQSY